MPREEIEPRGNGGYYSIWKLFYPVLIFLIFASCSFQWIPLEATQVSERHDHANRDHEVGGLGECSK